MKNRFIPGSRENPTSTKKKKRGPLVFPIDIAKNSSTHWVVFDVYDHKFMAKDREGVKDKKDTIILPIPLNLSTQYDQEYEIDKLGLIGKIAGENSDRILTALFTSLEGGGEDAIRSLADSVTKAGIKEAAKYYGTQLLQNQGPALGAAVGNAVGIPGLGAIGGQIAGQAIKGTLGGAGIALNPHMAVLYAGPKFRTHRFQYKFSAKNIKESEELQRIISAFKYYEAPGFVGDNENFFRYPEQFDIGFMHERYTFDIGPSVLTSFEINYHAEGYPAYFKGEQGDYDDRPAFVSLNMSFQEVFINTKKTIEDFNR